MGKEKYYNEQTGLYEIPENVCEDCFAEDGTVEFTPIILNMGLNLCAKCRGIVKPIPVNVRV